MQRLRRMGRTGKHPLFRVGGVHASFVATKWNQIQTNSACLYEISCINVNIGFNSDVTASRGAFAAIPPTADVSLHQAGDRRCQKLTISPTGNSV